MMVFRKNKMWGRHTLKDSYDVVIIGGGVHGLSTAYYLGQMGITDVAVLDKDYLGGGASARSTAIIRSNYLTAEAIPFFRESHKLYQGLASELGFNLLFDEMGRLDIGHSESSVYWLRLRAEFNQLLGVDSRIIGPAEIKELVPPIDLREGKPLPIMAALYHPPAGVVRHDAVVWGMARGADRAGVSATELHPFTEVTGITRENGRVTGVETSSGRVGAGAVVSRHRGLDVDDNGNGRPGRPNRDLPAPGSCVTEPVKPYVHTTISSADLHVYVYQTDRGELVIGGPVDPYSTYSQKSTLDMLHELAASTLELLPDLRDINILRQWAGLCDMTPDYAPIMGKVNGLDGFILNCGWGTWGFKAAPASGRTTAELIATGRTPELIENFGLHRFDDNRLVNERAAAIAAAIH